MTGLKDVVNLAFITVRRGPLRWLVQYMYKLLMTDLRWFKSAWAPTLTHVIILYL